ncbi:MAG: hypothetical protein AAGD13_19340 [Pseudomonadota bacterium]
MGPWYDTATQYCDERLRKQQDARLSQLAGPLRTPKLPKGPSALVTYGLLILMVATQAAMV